MIRPVIQLVSGRAALLALLLLLAASSSSVARVEPLAPYQLREACATRMHELRAEMAKQDLSWDRAAVIEYQVSGRLVVGLVHGQQGYALISFDPRSRAENVYDWEQPGGKSLRLHRHVDAFDLNVQLTKSYDHEALRFAARAQQVLDECLMEAQNP